MIPVFYLLCPLHAAPKNHPVKLTLTGLHGENISLRSLRGKVVVLNFWATWCVPCNAEMPLLVAAARQYARKNVVFLGASLDEASTQAKIPAFLEKYGVLYPVGTGATADDLQRLHMGVAVPATAFLDEDGQIRARILGQMRPEEIQQRVDWLLRNETPPVPLALVQHLDTPAP